MRLAVVLACVAATSCADGLFYRPMGREVPTAQAIDPTASDVFFASDDGTRLHGWWMPARGESRGTVVFCHGRKGNLAVHAQWVRWLPERGFDVLLFDYRGFGRSEGEPERTGTIADAKAALDIALQRDPHRTVVYGHSLGGAIAISAAADRPEVRAIVAESTFTTYRAAARAQVPVLGVLLQFLISVGDDPVDALAGIPPRPFLVVHGTEDRMIPFALGRELFEQAGLPKMFYRAEGNGHRTPWAREGERFEDVVVEFFVNAIGLSPAPAGR